MFQPFTRLVAIGGKGSEKRVGVAQAAGDAFGPTESLVNLTGAVS